ncbi:hypothetical protein BKA62DRAFT_685248 [Auriculariales sp. MPI-PUGE-AT-0066]|nr:hypothetical protein BKA62DRAFT_685248 [Auriculariales sp. MPI-PUGE-AT-0066]
MAPPNGIDLSHPDIRLYLRLVRLQVLTPLAVLICFATALVCTFIVHPSLGQVAREHPTAMTPATPMVTVYWVFVFASQIGFCVLLVFAHSEQTKQALVSLGLSVVLANWVLAGACVAWILTAFITTTILLGLVAALLLYANVRLLLRASVAGLWEVAFIHTPVRLFFIIVFMVDFWQVLFISMGHTWNPEQDIGKSAWQWEAVVALSVTSFIGLVIVLIRCDLVWTIGACFALASVAFGPYRGVPVLVTSVVFLVLFPVAFVAALFFHRTRSDGAIALPPDNENGATHDPQAQAQAQAQPQSPVHAPAEERDEEVERLRIRMQNQPEEDSTQNNQYQQYQQQPQRQHHNPVPVEESVWG